MDIEYSRNRMSGSDTYAYTFSDWEKKLIAKCLKPEIKKIEKEIAAIEADPNNEGQVTYDMAIREHRSEINMIKEIINEFTA